MRPTELVASGNAQICAQAFGEPSRPAVLLIAGATSSMDRWEPAFCERLAAEGRFVIRFDLRDTGRSTTCPPGEPDYTVDDLAGDALAVLDHFEVAAAHLVGISMGAGLVQWLAILRPDRVLSATLMASSPAGPGNASNGLPPMSDALLASFSGGDEPGAVPGPSDREAVIAHMLEAERPFVGRRGVDEGELRDLLGITYDRSENLASASNHLMIGGTDPGRARLGEIAVPTLVIHGSDDPLFPPAHGEALAREVRGATLLLLPGVGHEFPRSAWDEVLPAIARVTAGA